MLPDFTAGKTMKVSIKGEKIQPNKTKSMTVSESSSGLVKHIQAVQVRVLQHKHRAEEGKENKRIELLKIELVSWNNPSKMLDAL